MLKKLYLRGFRCALLALVTVVCLAPVRQAFATQAESHWTVNGVMKQLDREAKTFLSLKADIERTKVTVVVNDKSTESGQIFVRRDDKMRIEFMQPDLRTLLRTGNQVFLYNPKIKRVEEYDLGKHKAEVDQFLLLGFGTPGSELERGYKVVLIGEEELDKHQVLKLELTPKSDNVLKQVTRIDIWVDETTWLPDQQQFFEAGSEDYLLIHYTNVQRNASLSDNEFKPHWPKGVTRVKPEG